MLVETLSPVQFDHLPALNLLPRFRKSPYVNGHRHTVKEGNFNSKPHKQFHYCCVLSSFYDFICFATMHSSQESSYFFIEKKIKLDQDFEVSRSTKNCSLDIICKPWWKMMRANQIRGLNGRDGTGRWERTSLLEAKWVSGSLRVSSCSGYLMAGGCGVIACLRCS